VKVKVYQRGVSARKATVRERQREGFHGRTEEENVEVEAEHAAFASFAKDGDLR
jgi:hypothetical protein